MQRDDAAHRPLRDSGHAPSTSELNQTPPFGPRRNRRSDAHLPSSHSDQLSENRHRTSVRYFSYASRSRPLEIAYDVDQWQRALNAQAIPERRRQVDCHEHVVARLEWEHGAERLETIAGAWTRNPDFVLVELADARYQFRGVWLVPADVRRRSSHPADPGDDPLDGREGYQQ